MKQWLLAVTLLFSFFSLEANAASKPYIPLIAEKYRSTVIREARFRFGMDAPTPAIAAQFHQESRWIFDARSVFAEGLGQFTPDSAQTIARKHKELGPADTLNPTWSIRALIYYDSDLLNMFTAKTECDDWAFALSGYNGGPGWVIRDKKKAQQLGLDPYVYWGSVEKVNAGRAPQYIKENRSYPVKILLTHQKYYLQSGQWGAKEVCHGITPSQ